MSQFSWLFGNMLVNPLKFVGWVGGKFHRTCKPGRREKSEGDIVHQRPWWWRHQTSSLPALPLKQNLQFCPNDKTRQLLLIWSLYTKFVELHNRVVYIPVRHV